MLLANALVAVSRKGFKTVAWGRKVRAPSKGGVEIGNRALMSAAREAIALNRPTGRVRRLMVCFTALSERNSNFTQSGENGHSAVLQNFPRDF